MEEPRERLQLKRLQIAPLIKLFGMNAKTRFVTLGSSSGYDGGAYAHGAVPKRHIVPFVKTHRIIRCQPSYLFVLKSNTTQIRLSREKNNSGPLSSSVDTTLSLLLTRHILLSLNQTQHKLFEQGGNKGLFGSSPTS